MVQVLVNLRRNASNAGTALIHGKLLLIALQLPCQLLNPLLKMFFACLCTDKGFTGFGELLGLAFQLVNGWGINGNLNTHALVQTGLDLFQFDLLLQRKMPK
jgi:hypothetical protein